MKNKKTKTRTSYSPEFKVQAIELAKEIGALQAAEKLGIGSFQTLSAWVRYSKKRVIKFIIPLRLLIRKEKL